MPFCLIYGAKEVFPIAVMFPFAWLALSRKLVDPHDRVYNVKALEERRKNTEGKGMSY